MSDNQSISSSKVARACDPCRHRKVRCDRRSPCANCQLAGTQCSTSKRAPRQKQARVLISSQYENKIDLIESKLDRLIDVVDKLSATTASHPQLTNFNSSLASHKFNSSDTHNESSHELQSRGGSQPEHKVRIHAAAEDEVLVEGQSSLSAHSSFAMNFLHNFVGADSANGQNSEIGSLLETLRHIVDVSNDQRASSKPLLPLARKTPIRCSGSNMPPLDKMVFVLQKARDENHPSLFIFEMFLSSNSLSDLCLKVYFSQTYSDAEFIGVNTALYSLIWETFLLQKSPHFSQDTSDEYSRYWTICQTNIETALAELPLCMKASHDLTLALFLGAMYAIDISRPTLSWNLVSTASQHARSLGFHTRSVGAESLANVPNYKGLLFWGIYILEKFLCLRLGRSSSFQDNDITVPLPKASRPKDMAMNYFGQEVKLANIAGRIYEQLYCAAALSLPAEARQARVRELAQELQGHIEASRITSDNLIKAAANDKDRGTAMFVSMSDDVLRLSMLTLIHRAMPHDDLTTTFSDECITAARYALERHETLIKELDLKDSILSTYINWSILFVPFVPFIALFCHVIETGDLEDLTRLQTFAASLESACRDSRAIARHHRLFQVFSSVALRYTELRGASPPSQEESLRLRMEMDAQLNALGLQVPAAPVPVPGQDLALQGDTSAVMGWSGAPGMDTLSQFPASGVDVWEEQSLRLGNWFSFSQNMMGLMDQNWSL